ncbi:MAG: hypothetical protein JO271_06585 [Verrucomicrobia bacterium]|nr:hypothetical protein [Verrucomicrobiota bacterium]MBV9273866.1 hypothetical protein [Verrucomicrobiota bacterium]
MSSDRRLPGKYPAAGINLDAVQMESVVSDLPITPEPIPGAACIVPTEFVAGTAATLHVLRLANP